MLESADKSLPAPEASLSPDTYRANIRHLYAEITWMGFAFAMEWYYLNVYAIRMGATALQLAILTSGRALLMVLGVGLTHWWHKRYPNAIRAIALPLFMARFLLYFAIALAPFLSSHQVDALVALVVLSAVPTGISQGLFLGMVPAAIPKEAMARVVARRAVLSNIGVLPCIVFLSQFLQWFPQPLNYQAGFVLSFLVSLVSCWHISRIKMVDRPEVEVHTKPVNVWANPMFIRLAIITVANQASVFMAASLNGLQLVRGLNASDAWISVFGICELVAGIALTFRLDWLIVRVGTRRLIILSCLAVLFQTLVLALTQTLSPYIFAELAFGAGWFSINVLLYHQVVELFPAEDVPHYAAAFQLLINISLFFGPLVGTLLIEGGMTLPAALLVITVTRLVAVVLSWAIKLDRHPTVHGVQIPETV